MGRLGRAALRCAVLADPDLLDKVERVCRAYAAEPYAQRHRFSRDADHVTTDLRARFEDVLVQFENQ